MIALLRRLTADRAGAAWRDFLGEPGAAEKSQRARPLSRLLRIQLRLERLPKLAAQLPGDGAQVHQDRDGSFKRGAACGVVRDHRDFRRAERLADPARV